MSKITRNSLKELIRQSIDELKEGGKGSGRPKGSNSDRAFKKKYQTDPAYDKDYISDPLPDRSKKEESVKKPRKTTVKEVKKWFKTLEENRYKKTYASDARRVSWLVNNNLSEDYDAMPVSMKKKWPKAAYKRERFLAREFVKHLRTKQLKESIRKIVEEETLRESIRKIIGGLMTEQKLTEAKKIPYNEKDWKKYQKMSEKLSGNKSLMVIDKRGKEYSWEDGSKYGVVVMDRQDRTDSLKHTEIERLEIR